MMIHSSTTHSQLLTSAPPFAQRRGLRCWITNTAAFWHGGRDKHQPIDPNGLTPTTYALHRHADVVASMIDDALRAALDPIDQRIAELAGQTSPRPAVVPQTSHGHAPGSLAADEASRSVRQAAQEAERLAAQAVDSRQELDRLTRHRELLFGAASDLADSYSARCDELVEHHRRGRNAAHRAGAPTQPAPLRHRPCYNWTTEMPARELGEQQGVGNPARSERRQP